MSNNIDDLKFYSVVCPSCGADLDIENGIDTFYCKYCGTKVILENQSDATVKAKETIKKLEHKEAMTGKILEHMKDEREKSRKDGYVLLIILILIFAVPTFLYCYKNEKAEKEDASLQIVFNEIQDDVAQGNYELALMKAHNLYFTSSYSSSAKEKWDDTRETVIEQINKLQEVELQSQLNESFNSNDASEIESIKD